MPTPKTYKMQLARYDSGDYLSHRGRRYARAARRFVPTATRGARAPIRREITADMEIDEIDDSRCD